MGYVDSERLEGHGRQGRAALAGAAGSTAAATAAAGGTFSLRFLRLRLRGVVFAAPRCAGFPCVFARGAVAGRGPVVLFCSIYDTANIRNPKVFPHIISLGISFKRIIGLSVRKMRQMPHYNVASAAFLPLKCRFRSSSLFKWDIKGQAEVCRDPQPGEECHGETGDTVVLVLAVYDKFNKND